ncbi:MAG: helix-turn-helix transcriptional regulator [Cyclobacteriaceae bacterium]|nr:helix-turn-helix transcriptional regulator [Cyclobacteriaceae bacterium]
MPQDSIQSSFLEQVRQRLQPNISFAEELAELLHVSRDSAYRRIRGETVLSLDEVKIICSHFKISLDNLLSPNSDIVSFHHRAIDATSFTFEKWLQSVLDNLKMISSFPERELVYSAKDIPLFHYFQFPDLASFKMFFWMKSYHNYPQYANESYNTNIITKDLLATGKRAWELYATIPSTEIWSDETLNVTLSQINYYYESGFITPEFALKLYDDFTEMVKLIQQRAADGSKNGSDKNYNLYKNEIMIAETTILFMMGDKRVSFITYNTMNILSTSQEGFCQHIERYLTNLRNKSTLISSTAEKERNKFFKRMHEKIQHMKSLVVLQPAS